jgi:hypothetical protein
VRLSSRGHPTQAGNSLHGRSARARSRLGRHWLNAAAERAGYPFSSPWWRPAQVKARDRHRGHRCRGHCGVPAMTDVDATRPALDWASQQSAKALAKNTGFPIEFRKIFDDLGPCERHSRNRSKSARRPRQLQHKRPFKRTPSLILHPTEPSVHAIGVKRRVIQIAIPQPLAKQPGLLAFDHKRMPAGMTQCMRVSIGNAMPAHSAAAFSWLAKLSVAVRVPRSDVKIHSSDLQSRLMAFRLRWSRGSSGCRLEQPCLRRFTAMSLALKSISFQRSATNFDALRARP